MARREDKEAAKKGNFFTGINDNGNPSVAPKNRNNANVKSINQVRGGNPT
ncbi:MAG: hypothetical protein GX936_06155 [Clostridiales bacterium]|nr:hypothetical protein [Clostridiales bacterium]